MVCTFKPYNSLQRRSAFLNRLNCGLYRTATHATSIGRCPHSSEVHGDGGGSRRIIVIVEVTKNGKVAGDYINSLVSTK